MNLIFKTMSCLSFFSLSFLILEAKTIEILFDRQEIKTIELSSNIPNPRQDHPFAEPSFAFYCKQLKIENIGDKTLKNFFPFTHQPPILSLEALAARLSDERYPFLALYQLWNQSVTTIDHSMGRNSHPLDLINFKGACSKKKFHKQFIRLCNALGIETRQANVEGREVYDFGLDEEWAFLDPVQNQIYLGLDNTSLVSSEEVMDDPFLALRTNHIRKIARMDIAQTWKQLARFDIIEPASALPIHYSVPALSKRVSGFQLFPKESITFQTSVIQSNLVPYECAIEHVINLEARNLPLNYKHRSPFPIRSLTNQSTAPIYLIDQKVYLKVGQSYEFLEDVFQIKFAFSSSPQGKLLLTGICSAHLFPQLVKGKNQINLGAKKNPTLIRFEYDVNEELETQSPSAIKVVNTSPIFDFTTPFFELESLHKNIDQVWWQIGFDEKFNLIPSTFDIVQPFSTQISVPILADTFFIPGSTYYFRAKACVNGKWSDWSIPFQFKVKKPAAVECVSFDPINRLEFELNWERYAEKASKNGAIEYLVFGSNSLDFIPSIYTERQINSIEEDRVTEDEANDNLIAVTQEPKIRVNGELAFYRIIAKQRGQLSIPSKIIHVYDQDLVQPRNVLQVIKNETPFTAKRMLFPPNYSGRDIALPAISKNFPELPVVKLYSLLRAANVQNKKFDYEYPDVSDEIWSEMEHCLLPENHSAWPKLNRIFCKTRATQTPEHFKKAGFKRWQPGRWSRVAASGHASFPEYFVKAYCDSEIGILYDWKRWIHRIRGAELIRECIEKNELQSQFKVPKKWIYPLPKKPAPPDNSRYIRKNFILICENMNIHDHKTNEKMYKKRFNKKMIYNLYRILQTCGLYDSVYVFNMPFCKDGKIAFIDTEYHNKWPLPYHKLNSRFSKEMELHWKKITFKGGDIPDGKTEWHPNRMDRRDVKPDLIVNKK